MSRFYPKIICLVLGLLLLAGLLSACGKVTDKDKVQRAASLTLSGLSTQEMGWYCGLIGDPNPSGGSAGDRPLDCEEIYAAWFKKHPTYPARARQLLDNLNAGKAKISIDGNSATVEIPLPGGDKQILYFNRSGLTPSVANFNAPEPEAWLISLYYTNRANPGQPPLPS